MPSSLSRRSPRDLVLGAALFGATVLYLSQQPHDLNPADESLFLYEAKRILAGDVFYRDIFEIITPGGQYLMALCYLLFGATMTTARMAMAAVHGATAVVVFAACRALGCGRLLGLAAAAAYVALCQPAWPYASAHWISTCLTMALLLVALRRPWAAGSWWVALPGFLVGVMVTVQQQKGVVFALAFGLVLVLDRVLPAAGGTSRVGLPRLLSRYAAGAAAVVVPCFAALILSAGFGHVWRALVEHPLSKYREHNPPGRWGWIGVLNRRLVPYTSARLLKLLPAVLALDLARGAAACLRARSRPRAWPLAVLVVFGAVSVASIAYRPDFIHLAFIAPVFFVALAESVEWGARHLARLWRPLGLTGAAAGLCLLAAACVHLYRNLQRGHAEFPVAFHSAFGRIDVPTTERAEHYQLIRDLVSGTETKELFCYPELPALYLLTGARNPTPYQMLRPDYNFPDQIRNAIDIVERRKVPFVAIVAPFVRPGDPVGAYLAEHYEPVKGSNLLYRRKETPRGGGPG